MDDRQIRMHGSHKGENAKEKGAGQRPAPPILLMLREHYPILVSIHTR